VLVEIDAAKNGTFGAKVDTQGEHHLIEVLRAPRAEPSLGLGQYEAAFRDNAIDEKVLPRLTAEDLKDLGVGLVGHRRTLLDAIAAQSNGLVNPNCWMLCSSLRICFAGCVRTLLG
jgi:hypothetical protein